MIQIFDTSRLTSPEFVRNPYPVLRELRDRSPVLYVEMYGTSAWWLLRYEDVTSCLGNHRLFRMDPKLMVASVFNLPKLWQKQFDPLVNIMSKWLLAINPPEHTYLRQMMSHSFTVATLERMRSRIEQIVDLLLDRVEKKGQFDLIRDLAYPLPAAVISEIIGVAEEKQDLIIRCSDLIVSELGLKASQKGLHKTQQASLELTDYLRRLLTERRKHPGDDLLSMATQAEVEGQRLSDDEILAECHMLLFAGHETTRYLIRNGVVTLMRHPEQLQLLKQHPELMKAAVEEVLRYESPLFSTSRVVATDTGIYGQAMKQGQVVMAVLAAANRDPAQFEEPDRFDIRRDRVKQVAFGGGIHFCLGANLARLEAEIAFQKLFERLPNLSFTTGDRDEALVLRHTASLPLNF